MLKFPAIALLFFWACISQAKETAGAPELIEGIDQVIPGGPVGNIGYDFSTGAYVCTNFFIQHGDTTLMADQGTYNPQTGVIIAQGHVRVQQASQMWIGDQVTYNLKTHLMATGPFRTGRSPVYAQGGGIHGDVTNHTYMATNVFVTTDNVKRPAYYLRASRMKIVPGKYFEAKNAVLYAEGIPLLYYPYYRRNLELHANTLTVMPGDDSMYGPYLLGTYSWRLNEILNGKIHLDYREKRGVGAGPDLNLNLGRWGDASLKYYYLHDNDSQQSLNGDAFPNLSPIPENRQRFYLGWQSTPVTNLNLKALVNYQSDSLVLHDFFQSDYGQNPQPNTFVEANKYWDNWSVDVETTPRINSFFDQVERLPDIQLTGLRQQVFTTPVYYQSQSSVGYYEKYFALTNTLFGETNFTMPDYSAMRADTYQQVFLPETFFGWLNVSPHAGERVTYYGPETGAGGTNAQVTRTVFDTGLDASFTASQLWPEATNSLLDINGLRHIIVPSYSYVYVPHPSVAADRIPQFDSQLPSLMVLPVEFPDYNDIDAIESENVMRFGIRNTLQTMRNGQLDTLLDWNVMLDWNLTPNSQTNSVFLQPQKTFDDLYSDLVFKPRSWIGFQSQIRYGINDNHLNLAFHQVTLTPNDRWSLGLGHWYLHDGFVDSGDDVFTGTFFYRLNENWGFRTTEYFNAKIGRLQEQYYSVYRDMRSWTAALTFRVINNGGGQPVDYGVAFSISLKASPRFHVGDDTVRPYEMLGE
jgi:LPS-assembly protein